MKMLLRLIFCFAFFTLFYYCAVAQPINDACANAILFTDGTICITGTTQGATDDNIAGECNIHAQGTNANSVWYKFVATETAQTVRVQGLTIGPVMFDPVIAAFEGCGGAVPNGGACVDNSNDGDVEILSLTSLTIGNTYYIQVQDFYGRTTSQCQFTICLLPPNDACANAIALFSGTSCTPITGTTKNATDDNLPSECTTTAQFVTPNSVWYSFVATSVIETVHVQGLTSGVVMFDPVIAAFDGCGGTSPSGGACLDDTNDGAAETLFLTDLTIGHTYYIQVHDFYGRTSSQCQFTICVFNTPVANDICANAIPLPETINCTPTAGTTENANNEHITGECNIATNGNSVWYSFVATVPAETIYVQGSANFDAVVGVFAGCGGTSPTGGGCTDGSNSGGLETLPLTGLTVGSTYYIEIHDYNGDVSADATFTVCRVKVPPANDACANAVLLLSGASCTPTAGTTAGATDDNLPGQCTYATPNSVWYSFVATATAQTVYVESGPDFDAVLAAFQSCGGTVLSGGQCTDNTGGGEVETLALTSLTIGNTYLIQVYDYNGRNFGNSDFTICVFATPAQSNDFCIGAIAFPTIPTDGTTCATVEANTALATGTNDAMCAGNEDDDVWFTFTVPMGYTSLFYSMTNISGSNDRALQVFSGGCPGIPVGCFGDESDLLTGLTGGTTYRLRAYTVGTGVTSNFNICLRTAAINDECSGAISITSAPGVFANPGTQMSGFASQSQPPVTCSGSTSSSANDIWYSFQTDGNGGDITISVTPVSNVDLVLEGYTTAGNCSGASVCSNTSGNGTETITMTGLSLHGGNSADLTATYYFRVYRYNSAVPYSFNIAANGTALPIELKYFTGKTEDKINVLNWETVTEKNVQWHIVERSIDGINWREIGRKNGSLNSSVPMKYTLEDRTPLAKAYYRLRSIDIDGKENYSNSILLVRNSESFGIISVFPSPARDNVTVQFNSTQEETVTIRVIDMTGRLVLLQTTETIQDINELPLTLNSLQSGIYTVTVSNSTEMSEPVRFVKQ